MGLSGLILLKFETLFCEEVDCPFCGREDEDGPSIGE